MFIVVRCNRKNIEHRTLTFDNMIQEYAGTPIQGEIYTWIGIARAGDILKLELSNTLIICIE